MSSNCLPNPFRDGGGNSTLCEGRLKDVPRHILTFVLVAVLLKRLRETDAAGVDKIASIDEMGVDDAKSFSSKEGKWATDARRGLLDPYFLNAVVISHRIKEPLHMCNTS